MDLKEGRQYELFFFRYRLKDPLNKQGRPPSRGSDTIIGPIILIECHTHRGTDSARKHGLIPAALFVSSITEAAQLLYQ